MTDFCFFLAVRMYFLKRSRHVRGAVPGALQCRRETSGECVYWQKRANDECSPWLQISPQMFYRIAPQMIFRASRLHPDFEHTIAAMQQGRGRTTGVCAHDYSCCGLRQLPEPPALKRQKRMCMRVHGCGAAPSSRLQGRSGGRGSGVPRTAGLQLRATICRCLTRSPACRCYSTAIRHRRTLATPTQ